MKCEQQKKRELSCLGTRCAIILQQYVLAVAIICSILTYKKNSYEIVFEASLASLATGVWGRWRDERARCKKISLMKKWEGHLDGLHARVNRRDVSHIQGVKDKGRSLGSILLHLFKKNCLWGEALILRVEQRRN